MNTSLPIFLEKVNFLIRPREVSREKKLTKLPVVEIITS